MHDPWTKLDLPALTGAQYHAIFRVIMFQGPERLQSIEYNHLMDCVMLTFDHIVIGIEKDGYAHS